MFYNTVSEIKLIVFYTKLLVFDYKLKEYCLLEKNYDILKNILLIENS